MGSMWLLITINYNVVFFLVSDLKIVYYNNYESSITMDKRGKIFYITTYLETKSFKTVSKKMQPINMIIIFSVTNLKKKIDSISWKPI